MNTPRPSPNDPDTSLTSSRDAEREWWDRRREACERFASAPEPKPVATASQNSRVSESFAKLGRLLHALESQLKAVVEGTWEERELCFRRYERETHELARQAGEAVAAFKRKAFAMSDKYKEKSNVNH